MVEKNDGCVVSEQIGTVWGYEGVPKRRKEDCDDQNHFRWFQVINFVGEPVTRNYILGVQTQYDIFCFKWTISYHILYSII